MESNRIQDKILMYLKMNGQQTAISLSKQFDMTSEGMRLHLLKMEESGLVESESVTKGVGRPTLMYAVGKNAINRFPDNHGPLSVQLLETVQELLGKEVLELIMDAKRRNDFERYEKALGKASSTDEKLSLFSEMRNKEGYMTQLEQSDRGWLFIENHCPICSAAHKCDGFCHSEIENIRKLLGETIQVEREDHSLKGNRRCSYRIEPQAK
jgi:predicted ArsR family transcriptional regulator